MGWRFRSRVRAQDSHSRETPAPEATTSYNEHAMGTHLIHIVNVVLDQLRDYYVERNGQPGSLGDQWEWAVKIGLISAGDRQDLASAVRTRACLLVETAFKPRLRDVIRHLDAMNRLSIRLQANQLDWRVANGIDPDQAAVLEEMRRDLDGP